MLEEHDDEAEQIMKPFYDAFRLSSAKQPRLQHLPADWTFVRDPSKKKRKSGEDERHNLSSEE